MYKLKHASLVPIRPSMFRTGFPINEHMIPNIAIVSDNNSDPQHLNAIVLREALLSSPETVEQLLGLKVTDILTKSVPEETPQQPEPKKKVSKETKEVKPSKDSEEVEEWI